MPRKTHPRTDELELSLFGPGFGECLVVHLGNREWMIVDSCIDSVADKPVAERYLSEIGVDLSREVKLIVVSHWHDDHIKGASRLVRLCTSARFGCSAALRTNEFARIVTASEHIKLVQNNSGVSEISEIMEVLNDRSGSRFHAGPDHFLSDGQRAYLSTDGKVEVTALSPSSQTVTDAAVAIAALIPKVGNTIGRIPYHTPNTMSVVLHLKTPGVSFLLGADLEKGIDRRRGWQAILDSAVRPRERGNVYKVAHHGSPNADHEGIWTELVHADNCAVVTPYARGKRPLPDKIDVARLKRTAPHVYCTFWPITRKPPRRKGADGTINQVARTRRAVPRTVGHIRARADLVSQAASSSGEVRVDLYDGATKL